MALALYDRVKETTTTVGTGSVTLLGASTGFQSFAVVGNANTTYYCIADQGGANWEVGIGTYTASGTTLARTTVLSSSNAGALVSFTAGTKDVFVTYPSEKGLWKDASGNAIGLGTPASGVVTNLTGTASININGTVGATTATTGAFTTLAYTGTLTGSTGVLNIGSGQVYKDASGNVGIGTSVASASANVKLNLTNSAATYLQFSSTSSSNGAVIGCFAGAMQFFSYTGAIGSESYSEAMRINSSGNVGIGTSSPITRLDVYGAQVLNRGVIQALDSTAQAAGTGAGLVLGGFYTSTQTTSGVQIKASKTNGTSGDYGFDMSFLTLQNSTSNLTERMRIDSSGNVGIGTSSPSAKLAITQSTAGATALSVTGVAGAISYDYLGNGISYFDASQFNFRSFAGVNCATLSSGTNSTFQLTSSTGYSIISIKSATGSAAYLDFVVNNVGTARLVSDSNSMLAFATGSANTERMRIDSSGNVGIGTSSPAANVKLAVNGTIQIGTGTSSSAGCIFSNANYGMLFQALQTSPAVADFAWLNSAGTPRMTIDSSGNMIMTGINATSAAAPTIASATTIAPTKAITFISGVTPIVTITAPSPISLGGGTITLIPTGIFTTTIAGNIALASTAVVGRALTMTYDVTTTKWYPSY